MGIFMSNNILLELQNKKQTLSKGQKLIAEYIENHYDKAAFLTASKLGSVVGVSESTVVRFAYELGFDGYPGLQKTLQEMIRSRLTSVQRIDVASEQIGSDEILEKVLNLDIERIRKTIENTNKSDFETAINSILNAKNIYIVGSRSASTLANFIAYYFNLMFDNVKLVESTTTAEMFEKIIRVSSDDVVIGISFPRYSKQTSSVLNFAHNNKATVIAITDTKHSPIVKDSDIFLQARSDMVSFVDSLVAPLSLINALIVGVGLKKSEQLKSTFEKLEKIWDDYDVYEKVEESLEYGDK